MISWLFLCCGMLKHCVCVCVYLRKSIGHDSETAGRVCKHKRRSRKIKLVVSSQNVPVSLNSEPSHFSSEQLPDFSLPRDKLLLFISRVVIKYPWCSPPARSPAVELKLDIYNSVHTSDDGRHTQCSERRDASSPTSTAWNSHQQRGECEHLRVKIKNHNNKTDKSTMKLNVPARRNSAFRQHTATLMNSTLRG